MLILPNNSTAIPAEPLVITRRQLSFERAVEAGGTVAACLTFAAVAIIAGSLWFGASDAAVAYDGAPYAIVTVDR